MIFEKKVIGHKMCVLIFCTTFAWNILIPRKIERYMMKNIY